MTRILLLLIFIISFLSDALAQAPSYKLWDYRYGGTAGEIITSFKQTADGGYILGGYSSSSIGGDKTQLTNGGFDYWVVKLDSLGAIQWDKDFGGFDDDLLYDVNQTADGGFILGGVSFSGMTGDKTQPSQGIQDYWIVKINSVGVKEWDKTYGGSDADWLYSLQQTTDGGYMVGGYSYSDSSGDKTQHAWGSKDYWIIKTDEVGNMLWDKSYGGLDDDWFYALQQTTDNGYILGGFSNSNISGDKSQVSWGGYDCWIIKTDSLGNKQWDKDIGGTSIDGLFSLMQTFDGGFVFGGPSISGIGGDKSQASWGAYDYWIVKTDSLGVKQWDKDFGGTSNEEIFGNIIQTADSGFALAGLSYSGIGGDKTENNLGAEQSWIVKTDASGNKQWDKTIFTIGHDEAGLVLQSKDGCYVIANFTSANIGGYKSQPAWNNIDDYWVVKFCDSIPSAIVQTSDFQLLTSVNPNPFTNNISVTIQKQNIKHITIEIQNTLGTTLFILQENNSYHTYSKTLNLSKLSNGIYFLVIIVDGEKTAKKIVKQ